MSIGNQIQYLDRLSEDNFHLLSENPNLTTVILGHQEAWWSNMFQDTEYESKVISSYVNNYINKDIKPDVRYTVCGFDYPEYPINDYTGFTTPGKGIPWAKRITWPTYWFGWECVVDFRDNPEIPKETPTHLFSCFLNAGHKQHRVALMHSILDNDMIDKGIVRFCSSHQHWLKFIRDVKIEEETKGLTHTLLYKLLPHLSKTISQNKWGKASDPSVGFDPHYHRGFIDIVGASQLLSSVYCEKTARPLLFGKPFFIVGPPNVNKNLTKLGFELYDEIFDYNLDNHIDNLNPKTEDLVSYYNKMLKPLYDLNTSDIKNLHTKIKDKLLYNQKRIVDIIFDDNFIPEEFPEHLEMLHYMHGVQYPRKILAHSYYFQQFLSDEQKLKWQSYKVKL